MFKDIARNIKFFFSSAYRRFFLLIFRVFPIRNNRVIFLNFEGKGYGDSGKPIVEELFKSSGPQLDIIWIARPLYRNAMPNGIRYARYLSPFALFCLATARVWVNNSRFHYGTVKRKGQFYIQTWHSSLRLKKIEKDAEDSLGRHYLKSAKSDSQMIDILTSGCTYSTKIYREAFWYDGEILECGTPRMDLFFDSKQRRKLRENVCKAYGLDNKKKIILYAPTFRQNHSREIYLDVKQLAELLNNKYNILVRAHPNAKTPIATGDCAVDVTKHSDMQELICSADFLITDYSGCCFDALISNIPCILFTPDLEEYLAKERSQYFNFEQLPFPIVKTTVDLANTIKQFNSREYKKQANEFAHFVGLLEKGFASKTIADIIINKCKGK